jgi:uncharacterized protein (DUF2384 family)
MSAHDISELKQAVQTSNESLEGVDPAQTAQFFGVSLQTLNGIISASPGNGNGARSAGLARIESLLRETLDSDEDIRGYLHHPIADLSGQTPIALLLGGKFDLVEADLLAIQEGAYL